MKVFVTGGTGFIGGHVVRKLRARGDEVRVLVRNPEKGRSLADLGCELVEGTVSDREVIKNGMLGCDAVIHGAAVYEVGIPESEHEAMHEANVGGTENVIAACRAAGARRVVHVGTEAALMAGQPLVNVDEDAPLRPDSPALYSSSKARAEQRVRAANGDGLETVVVRPRFVWGRGDTTLLPQIVSMTKAGRFAWIGGGGQLTATTHIDNTVEGLVLGAARGKPGGVYFVTDGDPVVFREFVSQLIRTQGLEPPTRTLPLPVARAAAAASESAWKLLRRKDRPPLTRFTVWVSALECTINDSRAREELGYREVTTRAQGLEEVRQDAA